MLAGVSRETQISYEAGKTLPNTDYIEQIAGYAVDVIFLFTGQRSSQQSFPGDELILLDNYRHASNEDKALLQRMGVALAKMKELSQ
jgi:transcriptional regulator with XRE-family HTH domain